MTRGIEKIKAEIAEIESAARAYGRALNEGGEGYNPHADKLAVLRAELGRINEAAAEA